MKIVTVATMLWFVAPLAVHGHGSVVHPPPRQAIDRDLKPWSGAMPKVFPNVESKTGLCPVPGSADGKPSGQNGQACFCADSGLSCSRATAGFCMSVASLSTTGCVLL